MLDGTWLEVLIIGKLICCSWGAVVRCADIMPLLLIVFGVSDRMGFASDTSRGGLVSSVRGEAAGGGIFGGIYGFG